MADAKKITRTESPVSPIPLTEGQARPESPTTAQPLDFDDDHETTTPTKMNAKQVAPSPPPKDEAPPAKPPRPISAREQAENTLKEAFPSIDASVIRAVLTASGGQVEPAFNALLGMSDPDSQREQEPEQPPARPPRPPRATSTERNQLEADEMYARQLHEHFNNTQRASQPTQQSRPAQGDRFNENLRGSRIGRPGAKAPEEEPVWRSFIDDDLPEIRDNIKKGFFETQNTVNKWITNFKKTIDGEDEDSDLYSSQSRPAQTSTNTQYNRRSGEMRRSADMARYDADPQVIGDDFSKLNLKDGEHPPRTSSRPLANPNLFRPSSESTRQKSPGIARKVSFQEGPPEEIGDMYSSPAKTTTTTTVDTQASAGKASRWQPLSKVDPSPVTENDPFSLGDSDDEKDAKPITMKDEDENDNERVKKGLNEATADSIGAGKDTKVEAKK